MSEHPHRRYEAPSFEQLVNFAAVMALGPGATEQDKDVIRPLLARPSYREVWERRHRTFQEQSWARAEQRREPRAGERMTVPWTLVTYVAGAASSLFLCAAIGLTIADASFAPLILSAVALMVIAGVWAHDRDKASDDQEGRSDG